jgi:hypothetical protein
MARPGLRWYRRGGLEELAKGLHHDPEAKLMEMRFAESGCIV